MRNITVLTGSRAEYGLLKPIIMAINEHPKLKLSLIVSGMHLSKEFGYSISEIIKDGFAIDYEVEMNPEQDSGFSMAQSIGNGIIQFADAYKKIKPEILLVLGDRIEALAGVIAAAYMNIAIAHIHGGDSARAGLDESVRHGITKFAHIHFPATKTSAERIVKLGERSENVFVTGAPCLNTILFSEFMTREEVVKKFKLIPGEPYILLIQHSITTDPESAKQQIIETLEAIKTFNKQTVIIYPNSDAGGRDIIKQIEKYKKLPIIKTYKNLPQIEYLSLLKYTSLLIGNSSSGIIESSSFKIPVVNIGLRQEGRERAGNVIDVEHERVKIFKAMETALNDERFRVEVNACTNPYGDGKTRERIVKILINIKLDKKLLMKKLTY